MKHTSEQANYLVRLLKVYVDPDTKLIGSLGRGEKESRHDIDVLLPNRRKSKGTLALLKQMLNTKRHKFTDWGGIYFSDTPWGNVDVFFRMPK